LFLLHLWLPSGLFSSDFPTRTLNSLLFFPMSPTCPTHPICSDYADSLWRGVKAMRLFIMHFSPASCYCIPLWSKYSSQHPVLTHSQSMCFCYWGRPILIAIQICRQTYIWWLSSSGKWHRVALIRTDVSEDRIASIFRVHECGQVTERSCKLLYRHRLVGDFAL
jgi:hypothetical protein